MASIVAVLYDVVEDTSVTIEDLRAAGFAETILASVPRVTHGKDESYVDYVVRCKTDPIAKQVKLADSRGHSAQLGSAVRAGRRGNGTKAVRCRHDALARLERGHTAC